MKRFNITVDGKTYAVEVEEVGGTFTAAPVVAPAPVPVAAAPVAAPAPAAPVAEPAPVAAQPSAPAVPISDGDVVIDAPMNGTIIKINCKIGDVVKEDTAVVILEAMKMENEIFAGVSGTVKDIRTSVGAAVQPGDALVVLG